MTNTQHTPGPWATDGREYGWHVLDLTGKRLATVWRGRADGAKNARLIAAAPELLAALEACLAVPNKNRPDYIWANARAAIAKATGGQL